MNGFPKKLQPLAGVLFLLTVFIAPLKMGVMLLPGAPQGFPDSAMAWVVTAWPPALFPVIAGVLLIVSLIAYGIPESLKKWSAESILLLLWLLLPLVTMIGFIDCDSYENAVIELEYTLGLSSFFAAAVIQMANRRDMLDKVVNTAVASVLFTAVIGVHQYFFGFDDMRDFIEMQEKIYNITIPEGIKARAYDVRVHSTFTFASALAGLLALWGALAVVRPVKWAENFEPVKVSQKIFFTLALILCGFIFLAARGRGAFLAVILAGALTGWGIIRNVKVKIALSTVALLAIILGAVYIHYAGRGFGSMEERVGYLKSSWEMFIAHPFTGDGWGDFVFHHAQNKSFGSEELAKDPHNMLAAFAAQTGIGGLLLIGFIILYTLFIAYRYMQKKPAVESCLFFFGISAFSLHILMDMDWQVPALMIYYQLAALCIAGYSAGDSAMGSGDKKSQKYLFYAVLSVLALCSVTGGTHWSIADQRYFRLQEAAGQDVMKNKNIQSSFVVDRLAQAALAAAPYSHSVYICWGNEKFFRGDLVKAEEFFRKVLEMTPRSHSAHKRMSEIYLKRGDEAMAREYLEKSEKLFPYKKILFEQRMKKK